MTELKTQYWNPTKQEWVDKLPKSFINKLVKTRQVSNYNPTPQQLADMFSAKLIKQ